MESIFSNYGIEIVVGMIFTVLAFLLFRVIYYGCIKKWNQRATFKHQKSLDDDHPNLEIEQSLWYPIIVFVRWLKIDDSQWNHWMRYGDVFCTLY